MTILTMSVCDRICERYEQIRDKFTLLHASKHQEPNAMSTSLKQEKSFAQVQAADEYGYLLVYQANFCAVPMVLYRDQDRLYQVVHGSVV